MAVARGPEIFPHKVRGSGSGRGGSFRLGINAVKFLHKKFAPGVLGSRPLTVRAADSEGGCVSRIKEAGVTRIQGGAQRESKQETKKEKTKQKK